MWQNSFLTILALLALLWIGISFLAYNAFKKSPYLFLDSGKGLSFSEKISVILPARNEARDIRASLESIIAQDGVNIEIIVVNDHSTDKTGAILEEMQKVDSRIKVVTDPPLQDGWLGKCNAMQNGAKIASGEYFLFSDADIIHTKGSFKAAYSEMIKKDYAFFSLLPAFRLKPFWENVNMPMYIFGIAKLFANVDPENPNAKDTIAAGAFMMIRKKEFDAVGGFEQVRKEMADDISMARLMKKTGYKQGYCFAPELLQVELFKNNKDAFWGPVKNILFGVDGKVWMTIPVIFLTMLIFWTPFAAIIAGIIKGNSILAAAGIALYLIQYLSFFISRKFTIFSPVKSLFFPLTVISANCCILRALYYAAFHGSVFWRGRNIKVK